MQRIRFSSFGVLAACTCMFWAMPTQAQVFSTDFGADNGAFTVTNAIGAGTPAGPWVYNSGAGSWSADGGEGVVNSALDSPVITVPSASSLEIDFNHRYNFEDDGTTRWDAGQLRISTNGGAFEPVLPAAYSQNGPPTDRPITGNSPPLNGQFAFNNTSPGFGDGTFINSVASLGDFNAGDELQLRFIGAWDEGFIQTPAPNWEIDSVLVSAGALPPSSIGFNFSSDREDAALGPDESAGVVPQVNWNNWDGIPSDVTENTLRSQLDIASPNPEVVTDSNGTPHPGVTVNWQSRNAWNTDNGVSNGDNKLMNGYIDNDADTPQVTVDVGDLPAAITEGGYDVYVYIGSDGNGRTGTVTDGTTTYSYTTFSQQAGAFPGAYAVTTDTAGGNPNANYAVFSGLTGDSFSITVDRGSNNSGIHGLQIVGVPEPTTIGLLSLAGLIVLGLRRRR